MRVHHLLGLAALAAVSAAVATLAGPAAGPAATTLVSIDELNGLACSSGVDSGVIVVTTAADGTVSFDDLDELTCRRDWARGHDLNTGGARADLGGFRLVYRSAAGTTEETLAAVPAGVTLDPGARYVFGGTTFWGPSNQTYNSGMASAAGGVGLRAPSGQLVDSLGYGNGTTNAFVEGAPAAAPAPGASISRLPDGQDSNYNAADFSATSPPTPGAVNHA
jgi:hypothetical protein